jgi:hypothetical protein
LETPAKKCVRALKVIRKYHIGGRKTAGDVREANQRFIQMKIKGMRKVMLAARRLSDAAGVLEAMECDHRRRR